MLLLFSALLERGRRGDPLRPLLRVLPEVREVRGRGAGLRAESTRRTPSSSGRRRWRRGSRRGPRVIARSTRPPTRPGPCSARSAWPRSRGRGRPWVVSDEIYHGLTYEGPEHTVLEFTDHAFVLNGFSKAYAMTGWRVGYVIAPRAFMPALTALHGNFFISTNEFVQWAALAALREAGGRERALPAHLRRAAPGDGGRPPAHRARGGRAAHRRLLRAGQRPPLHERLARLRVRDPRAGPRGA